MGADLKSLTCILAIACLATAAFGEKWDDDTESNLMSIGVEYRGSYDRDEPWSLEDLEYVMPKLRQVKAAGVPDSYMVEPSEGQKPTSLGELRKDLEARLATARKRAAGEEAAEQERWARYTAIVKGDRLAYVEAYRAGSVVYGPGGKAMHEPEEFRDAAGLYTCSYDIQKYPPTWTVNGSHFRGDKRIGSGYTATGIGSDCPPSAFK